MTTPEQQAQVERWLKEWDKTKRTVSWGTSYVTYTANAYLAGREDQQREGEAEIERLKNHNKTLQTGQNDLSRAYESAARTMAQSDKALLKQDATIAQLQAQVKELEARLAAGEPVGEALHNVERDVGIRWLTRASSIPHGALLYLAPPAQQPAAQVPDGKDDAIRAICNCWSAANDFVLKHATLLGDAMGEYPVMQGTGNQMRATRIGRQPIDYKMAGEAMRALDDAMLAAAPTHKGASR